MHYNAYNSIAREFNRKIPHGDVCQAADSQLFATCEEEVGPAKSEAEVAAAAQAAPQPYYGALC
jgi:hypothetical protein